MKFLSKLDRADMPEGGESPLGDAVTRRDRETLDIVAAAVRHRQTMLAYQPVLQARPPHGVAFHEGLIRILDPAGRVIPARDFMAEVEDTELGREIDCLALEMGLRNLVQTPSLRLSINMSARSIGYKRWNRILARNLKRDDTLGERLILEISELSAMTVPELVVNFMDGLIQHNISFALDDFGAGQTTLRHFRSFFFDAVKIDAQFIRGIHANPDNQVLVQALLDIARQFDMFTVAEAVETAEEAKYLIAAGVDCLQGYLLGAPTVRPPWLAKTGVQAVA